MKRREAREAAFLLLFEWSFRPDESLEEVVELAQHCRDAEVDAFCTSLASGAMERVEEFDRQIEKYSDNWKLARLSRVTLAVLRMSLLELSSMDSIPPGVTINEAVELMKKYATEDEASFVNGVLGAYHRANPQQAAASREA